MAVLRWSSFVGVGCFSASHEIGTGAHPKADAVVGSLMTIVIAAGGTGGHLYPAIALARNFWRNPMTKVLFVGTTRGLESKVLAHRDSSWPD
jgi:hypothetical protein